MKKTLLLAGMLAMGLANAQTGKVGINTETPQETLEVNGTLRVDNLPVSGTGTIYNGADTTATTFTGADMMVADAQGNVGKVAYPFVKVLAGVDGADAFPVVNYDYPVVEGYKWSGSGNRSHEEVLKEVKIVVEKRSLVDINLQLGFSLQSYQGNTANFLSEDLKRVGAYVKLNGENIMTPGIPITRLMGEKSKENRLNEVGAACEDPANAEVCKNQTSGAGIGGVTGVYTFAGRDLLILEPGEYTLTVSGRVTMGQYDTTAFRIRWGSSSFDRFDVIAFPLEF